jgi:hypothetical protein
MVWVVHIKYKGVTMALIELPKDKRSFVSNDAKQFKHICVELYEAQKPTNSRSYDEVVSLVLTSEYKHLMSEATLEDIGFIYDFTRERIRQMESTIVNKLRNPDGKLNRKLWFYVKRNHILSLTLGKDRPGTPINLLGKMIPKFAKPVNDFEHRVS